MSIQTKIQVFKDDLDFFDDELQKYEFVIDLGKKLKPFDEALQIDKNLVQGCTSQVWLVCEKKENKLYFYGTSDAIIVKGLVYIILEIFSGESIAELNAIDMDIIKALNLSEVITPNRQSGLTGMIKKIKMYANEYKEML
jgi:cysteine desulfuration protein SufE